MLLGKFDQVLDTTKITFGSCTKKSRANSVYLEDLHHLSPSLSLSPPPPPSRGVQFSRRGEGLIGIKVVSKYEFPFIFGLGLSTSLVEFNPT